MKAVIFCSAWLTINNALGSFQEKLIVGPVRWNKLAALSPDYTKVYQRVQHINTAASKPVLWFGLLLFIHPNRNFTHNIAWIKLLTKSNFSAIGNVSLSSLHCSYPMKVYVCVQNDEAKLMLL